MKVPGWYADALEQNLGMIIADQRKGGKTVEELAEVLLDKRRADTGEELSGQQHVEALAVCLAICVRRLARIDMPA